MGNISFSDKESLSISDNTELNYVSEALGLNKDVLEKILLTEGDVEKANTLLEKIAESLYITLWRWLATKINQSLTSKKDIASSIGILTLPGPQSSSEVLN